MIHPPMLYSGYVAFTIPFAFAVGALITRRLDAAWIRATRRFALIAWAFLGFGLLLGARWSYTELGWGGYWAWDPVENAALMPWLIGTAFLHSIMVQEKRGMLKVWNACLIVATFSLALLGTFLVRSGVLQSIHAFGDSTVGPYILGLIAVVLIGSTALIVSRLDDLRSEKRIDSLVSREAVFLVNNLLLVALCAAIFWGTFFPLISELFTGTSPRWRRPGSTATRRRWRSCSSSSPGSGRCSPGAGSAGRRRSGSSSCRRWSPPRPGVALAALHRRGARSPGRSPSSSSPTFALAGLAQEFWRGAAARRSLSGGSMPAALVGVVARNRRRYGGYIVHVGIAVLLIGIAASSSFQTNRDVELRPGQSAVVDGRTVTYVRPTVERRQARPPSAPCSRVATGRQDASSLHAEPALLPPDRGAGRHDRQLLRRRADQRGRAQGGPRQRLLDRGAARHRGGAAPRRAPPTGASATASRGAARHAAAVPRGRRADAGGRREPARCARWRCAADRSACSWQTATQIAAELPRRRRRRRPSA